MSFKPKKFGARLIHAFDYINLIMRQSKTRHNYTNEKSKNCFSDECPDSKYFWRVLFQRVLPIVFYWCSNTQKQFGVFFQQTSCFEGLTLFYSFKLRTFRMRSFYLRRFGYLNTTVLRNGNIFVGWWWLAQFFIVQARSPNPLLATA